jgi:acylphosphatase
VAGSARNLPDGRVEVVLEGAAGAVRSVVAELDGSRAPGRVTRVDVRSEAVQGSNGFTVL